MKIILMAGVLFAFFAASAAAEEIGGAHAELGLGCADCHQSETPDSAPVMQTCLGCHGNYEELAKATAPASIDPDDKESSANPHDSHMGPIDCHGCHKTHSPPELVCAECHNFDFEPK